MDYTVKQLSELAGVSPRTLHYYDQIDLLKPARVGENGYRYYGEESIWRLQQILFYKELDFSLEDIRRMVGRPDFDLIQALQSHRKALQGRLERMKHLIETVDRTIKHLQGEAVMEKKILFQAFSEEQQEEYAREAEIRWGEGVAESNRRWKRYSAEEKQRILSEAGQVYEDMIACMVAGKAPDSAEMQETVRRWHVNMRNFFEPSKEALLGLADAYHDDPAFRATFDGFHPELAPYARLAIQAYVSGLK